MNPEQQKVLEQLNRSGWRVVGERPHTSKTQQLNPDTGRTEERDAPDGAIVWTIVGPNGQSDEVVVKPYTAPTGFSPTTYSIVQGPKENPQQPAANAGWTDITPIRNPDGSSTYYGRNPATGKFEKVPDVPNAAAAPGAAGQPKPTPAGQLETITDPTTGKPIKLRDPSTGTVIDLPDAAAAKTTTPPSDPSTWKPIKDESGRTIALLDPATGDRQAVTQPAQDKNATAGSPKQTIENGRAITWVADGQGNWNIKEIGQDITGQPKPKEGDIRPNVIDGQQIQQVFRGGQWVVDPSVQPKPFGTKPPEVINAGTGPNIIRQDPTTGAISSVPNPNTTDVTSRVAQLQQQAQTKRDQLQQDVLKGVKSKEDAAAEFDTWWSANVDPYSAQLQRQQQQTDYDLQIKQQQEQRLQMEAERGAYSTAQQAGQNAVANATNFGPGVQQVGPGYAGALTSLLGSISSGKMPGPIDASGLVWQGQDLNELARKATAEALAHISPTAASIAGRPMPQIPQSFDVAGALNKSNYQFSGPTTQIAPDGTVTITHQQSQLPPLPAYVPSAQRGGLDYALPPQTF